MTISSTPSVIIVRNAQSGEEGIPLKTWDRLEAAQLVLFLHLRFPSMASVCG
jgi:hypothetical protein